MYSTVRREARTGLSEGKNYAPEAQGQVMLSLQEWRRDLSTKLRERKLHINSPRPLSLSVGSRSFRLGSEVRSRERTLAPSLSDPTSMEPLASLVRT